MFRASIYPGVKFLGHLARMQTVTFLTVCVHSDLFLGVRTEYTQPFLIKTRVSFARLETLNNFRDKRQYTPLNQPLLCCSKAWHMLICYEDQLSVLQCRYQKPPEIFHSRNIHCLLASWTVDVLLSLEQKKIAKNKPLIKALRY